LRYAKGIYGYLADIIRFAAQDYFYASTIFSHRFISREAFLIAASRISMLMVVDGTFRSNDTSARNLP
jgi:hypothetical protein